MRKKLLKSLIVAGVMMMFPMSVMAADGDAVTMITFENEEELDSFEGVKYFTNLESVNISYSQICYVIYDVSSISLWCHCYNKT